MLAPRVPISIFHKSCLVSVNKMLRANGFPSDSRIDRYHTSVSLISVQLLKASSKITTSQGLHQMSYFSMLWEEEKV